MITSIGIMLDMQPCNCFEVLVKDVPVTAEVKPMKDVGVMIPVLHSVIVAITSKKNV